MTLSGAGMVQGGFWTLDFGVWIGGGRREGGGGNEGWDTVHR